LAEVQKEYMKRVTKKEKERVEREKEEVDRLQRMENNFDKMTEQKVPENIEFKFPYEEKEEISEEEKEIGEEEYCETGWV
jgi:hypothetical protein